MIVKKKLKERTYNAGNFTEAQYFSKIRSSLRNAFRFWKPMQIALELSSRPSQSSNKRIKKEYQCAYCKQWFPRKDVEIDHIEECGSLKSYEDIVPFIKRLTKEEISSYQILCKKHHKLKTGEYLKSKRN